MSTSTLVQNARESGSDAGPYAQVEGRSATQYRLNFPRVLRSEWIKFRTLKSNLILLAASAIAMILFGIMAASSSSGDLQGPAGAPPIATDAPVELVLSGANFAVLLIGVLGVLIGAREYSSGAIRTTLAAVPTRLPVLGGKIAVFVLVAIPTMLIAVLLAFEAGTAILTAADVTSASLSDAGAARAVIGTALYLVGIGVIGICLGFLMRSIASGLATLIGGVLILPTLASVLLPESWDGVLKYLPSNAGVAFTSVTSTSTYLSVTTGAIVFCLWLAVAIGGAAWTLKRRDA